MAQDGAVDGGHKSLDVLIVSLKLVFLSQLFQHRFFRFLGTHVFGNTFGQSLRLLLVGADTRLVNQFDDMVAVHGTHRLADLTHLKRFTHLDKLWDDAAHRERCEGASAWHRATVVGVVGDGTVPIFAVLIHQFLIDVVGLLLHGCFVLF